MTVSAIRVSLVAPLVLTAATALGALALRPGDAGTTVHPTAPAPAPAPPPTPTSAAEPAPQVASPFDEPKTLPRPAELWLTVSTPRGAYLQVEALELDAAPSGARITIHDGELVATAKLSPELASRWQHLVGRRVTTERGCTTTIAGLQALTRVLSVDGRFEQGYQPGGEHTIVAARLAGCARKLGAYARAAETGPVAMAAQQRPELEQAARALLAASPQAAAAEARWQAEGNPGRWLDSATWDVRAVVHPTTGVTWVVAHAGNPAAGCGDTALQLALTYSVDAHGRLVPHDLLALAGDLTLVSLLDADHDGAPELLAATWLAAERTLLRSDGAILDETRVDLFGCPC